MDKEEILQKNKEYLFPAIAQYYKEPLIISSGKGNYLYDIDGKEYLDFFGGILTVSIGHCNEEITEKICAQAKTLQHTSTLYLNTPLVTFAEKMAQLAPGNLNKCFFTNSGTEANETAMLAAKLHTGRQELITLRYSYHGRSMLAMSASCLNTWRLGGTHVPGIKHAHNGYCYRCAFNLKYPECELRCAQDVEELILTETSGKIAGFIAEPIQGVAGFITPPKEYFTVIYDIIKKYGGVFISDEVQTGLGRTGDKWWGIENYDVKPDMITCAKGIANGAACGVTVAAEEIANSFKGVTISTFGGGPVASIAGTATLEYIAKNNLSNNAKVVGDYVRDRFNELQEKYSIIGDVRGMGLMQAMELADKDKKPAVNESLEIMEKTKEKGLLVGRAGLFGNVLRFAPCLNVTKADIDAGIEILDKAFAEVVQ